MPGSRESSGNMADISVFRLSGSRSTRALAYKIPRICLVPYIALLRSEGTPGAEEATWKGDRHEYANKRTRKATLEARAVAYGHAV